MTDEAKGPLDELREQNQALFSQIEQNGARLDPSVIMDVRIATLLDLTLHGPYRHLYDVHVEQRLNEVLTNVAKQVAQSKLMEGVPEAIGKV